VNDTGSRLHGVVFIRFVSNGDYVMINEWLLIEEREQNQVAEGEVTLVRKGAQDRRLSLIAALPGLVPHNRSRLFVLVHLLLFRSAVANSSRIWQLRSGLSS
jgi:hypothetical protein